MREELIKANRKKVWTNVTLRLDQDMKLSIIERANSEGLNTNQFLAKIVNQYLTDSSHVDNFEMHNSLTDLLFKCQQRIGRLTAENADLINKLHVAQSESLNFDVTSDSFAFVSPDAAREQSEEDFKEELKKIEDKYIPKKKGE